MGQRNGWRCVYAQGNLQSHRSQTQGEEHMRDTIDMAREAGFHVGDQFVAGASEAELKAFEALVRADERNSWPAEMEAMERQVNILTDALADRARGNT
jgi:hypothetical protein